MRCHPLGIVFRLLGTWVLTLGLTSAPVQTAWAGPCEVIDFSAVKQRSKSSGISTLIATPAAAPGDIVVLEDDVGCKIGPGFHTTAANNVITVEVLGSKTTPPGEFLSTSLSTSWESFTVTNGSQVVTGCFGGKCTGLTFTMPDEGLAGPARITVEVGGTVVARVFELGARTASCEVDAPDTFVGAFTLLPAFNQLVITDTGAPNFLTGALAFNESVLLPTALNLLGEPAVDAQLGRYTGPEVDAIPNQNFLRVFSRLFRPLPSIIRLVPFSSGKALYATADVPRATLQMLPADPLNPSIEYPLNFHEHRTSAAGPVALPNAVDMKFEGASPVVALRSSPETVAFGLSEALLGDLNADNDTSDLLFTATDIPSGVTTSTEQAIALIAASPELPVSNVRGTVAAFLHDEGRDNNTDLNGDGSIDDQVVRVLKSGVRLNPGVPTDTTADPLRSIDGQQFGVTGDYVLFRTPEIATAPQTTARVSDVAGTGGDDTSERPSVDDLGEHVAYASRAANLAAGASGADSQILVTDLMTGMHTLVSGSAGGEGNGDSFEPALSAGGSHVSFTSQATNLAALGGGGGTTQVVWERGTNVQGVTAGGLALALFELEPGDADVSGVDYAPCTAGGPGLSISFADDMTVVGALIAPDGPGCTFIAEFEGTWDVAPAGPIQVGSVITVSAVITSSTLFPPLAGVSDLGFSASNIVTDLNGPFSFDFQGSFELTGSTGVANTVAQVYARALGGGAPALASVALGGGGGSAASGESVISGDGQQVAFTSLASDLVDSDTNNASDVFVRNLATDTTTRVSVANNGGQAGGASSQPAMTPDGNWVAFASLANNLVGGGADTNGASDVFLRNRSAGTTERISVPAGGSAAGPSASPDLSHDARFVVFESGAPLVPADTNGVTDVYLRDRVEGETRRMSVASGGEQVSGGSFDPKISGDGTFVIFSSTGSLLPGAPQGTNVYRKNRITGTVELLSVGASNGDASTSGDPDRDGRTVAFDSDASLVLNDSLPVDVFVRDTGMGTDLNGDADDFDSVFQSFFASTSTPGLQPAAQVAASSARTGFGRALVTVPEADQGNTNLNATSLIVGADGDGDTTDGVLHLWDGLTAQMVNLGIAGTQGALSGTTLCALVDETQQNETDLGGSPGANDRVLVAGDVGTLLGTPGVGDLVNTGRAATQVHVADTVCIYTDPAGTLRFFDLSTGFHVSSGLPATAIMIGPNQELIAFRVPESLDLNGDGDSLDEVMHLVSKTAIQAAADGATISGDVTNLALGARDCTLPGCLAFPFGAILNNGAVSFLGTEPGENRDPADCLPTTTQSCDFNGDGDGGDTVVHYVKAQATGTQLQVTSVGSLALSSAGEQETSPFPTEDGTISIWLTECEAAEAACGIETGQAETIPPPLDPSCESKYDVNLDGSLDCTIRRRFLGIDSDKDGIPDPFDNCIDDFNPEQEDADGDDLGDFCDGDDATLPPCLRPCDLDENGVINQTDVDAILSAVASGAPAQGGTLSPECGDRRDRNADRKLTFLDASLCKADCVPADCSGTPPSVPAVPAGGGGAAPGCGIGPELALLVPLLMAVRRRWRGVHFVEGSY